MKATQHHDPSLQLSIQVYAALLRFYPTHFRQEYGSHMLQVFADCARAQLRSLGMPGLAAWWSRVLFDTLTNAIEQHTQQGVDMSKTKFIQLAAWALPLGSLLTFLGFLASNRPTYSQYNFASKWPDYYANLLDAPLILVGLLSLSLGMFGLLAQYAQPSGAAGWFTLGLGGLSGIASAVGAVGLEISDSNPWWSLFFFGLVGLFLCLALWGIICLQKRLLPRWNFMPLFAGFWVPAWTVVSMAYEEITGKWLQMPDVLANGLFIVSLGGMALLGYVLVTQSGKDLAQA